MIHQSGYEIRPIHIGLRIQAIEFAREFDAYTVAQEVSHLSKTLADRRILLSKVVRMLIQKRDDGR